MPKTESKILSSFVWSFLEQGGTSVVSLVVQLVLARILDPDAFGVMAILLVLISVASTIAQSGFGMALIQKQDASDLSFSTAMWLSLLIAAGLYALIFFGAPVVASLYGMPSLDSYLKVLGLIVFFDAFNGIQRAFLQKSLDFKALFKSNTTAVLLSGCVGVGLAVCGCGVWALVAQSMTQAAVVCAVMFAQVPWRPSLDFSRSDAVALFSYGWKICVTGILNTLYTGLSELILGKVCSASDLGVYSQGRKWPNAAVSIAMNSLQNVLFPVFSEMSDDMEALRAAMRKAIAVGSYVIIPIALFLAVAADPIVELLLSEKWMDCVPVFQLVCIENIGLVIGLVNLRAYMALGDSALYLKLQIIKVSSGIAFICGIAVYFQDIICVALAACAHGIFCAFVNIAPASKRHGLGAFSQLRIVAPILVAAAVSACAAYAVLLLQVPSVAQFLLQILVFGAVYLGISFIAKLPGFGECKNIVEKYIRK